ncbi:MAG TPA: prepilin-type N-terminal cleavage/methylation domain-containing protein [Halioglobus sp.]
MKPVVLAGATRCQPRGEMGFTLVEVMVAITILTLIMLTTVTALRTLGNTQGTIEKLTHRIDEVRSVSTFLRDLMESAVVARGSTELSLGGENNEASYFLSGDDFLELKSTILFGERYGGSYLVRVAKEDTRLVLRWQESPADGVLRDWMDAPSRVLVDQLDELKVATRQEYSNEWSDTRSTDEPVAPALVRLQLKAAGRYWPDLIVQVQR